jgi:hypothetical protein
MVSVSELIETLQNVGRRLSFEATELTNKITPHVKGSQEENFLLSVCIDLQNHSHQIV